MHLMRARTNGLVMYGTPKTILWSKIVRDVLSMHDIAQTTGEGCTFIITCRVDSTKMDPLSI